MVKCYSELVGWGGLSREGKVDAGDGGAGVMSASRWRVGPVTTSQRGTHAGRWKAGVFSWLLLAPP